MALSYKQAPTVTPGATITSSQWNALAQSFNDRLLGGVGDPTYRLHWFWHSLFRVLRAPNGSNFAPEDEWWKIYAHVQPDEATFPTTAAGQPEGAFLGNPINGFVFGNGDDIKSEAGRLSYDSADGQGILLHNTAGAPATDSEKWDIGRYQRGVVDGSATTDLSLANALVAARSHFNMGFFKWFQRSYGGFIPRPAYNGQCANSPDLPDYALKFTNTSVEPNTSTTYSTCPGQANAVFSWFKASKDYILLHWDGTVSRLPIADYIEGPYDGANNDARLAHPPGDQLPRALNAFVEQFRGTPSEQAASGYKVEEKAFDFESFLTRQYYLAPAYGTSSGGTVTATYERFGFDPSTSADTYGGLHDASGNVTGTTSYAINSGFVLAGVLAFRDAGTGDKTFSIEVDGTELAQVTIPNGDDSKSAWFSAPAGGTVRVKNITAMGASDECYVEIAELLEYKPENEDAYLVLRCGSTSSDVNDREGKDQQTPKDISDAYFRHGMIYNEFKSDVDDTTAAINANPIYRTVAEQVRKRLRMVDRHGLVGYEVSGGKSVLYFNRRAFGLSYADQFEDIAPSQSAIASGAIQAGIVYTVSGGTSITYNGATVAAGAQFTGAHGVTTYTKTAGTESVLEYELIRENAPEAGYSNQWSMFMQSIGYQDSESSAYKTSGYSDVIGWGHDRCAMFSKEWTNVAGAGDPKGKEILPHVTPYPGKYLQRSENPTGYRYLLSTHDVPLGEVAPGTANTHLITQANYGNCEDSSATDCIGANGHYKSCKVYVPDYKVTSVRDAGNNQVRVELDRRLSYNEDAPSTIADNATSRAAYIAADSTGSTNGGYRTDENAVVDYLNTFIDGSGTECGQRIGDMAPDADSTSGWSTSEINGSCMPRFYFTRLIPYVYEDSNADYDTTDTLAKTDELTWMESILRAICEGFVDSASTNTQRKYTDPVTGLTACHNKRLYDWTFEQLMYSANDKQHYRALPKTVRSDEVRGFGPQPSMLTYADHFNQLAEAVNLLTRARLYLPVSFQYKHYNYLSETLLSVSTNASTANCSNGAVWADNVVPTANYSLTTFDANWRDSAYPTGNAYQQCRIDADTAGNCILKCEKRDVHYRFALTDEALNSLPADLRTLVDTNTALGYGAIDENQTLAVSKTQVSAGSGYGSAGGTNGVENDYVHDSKYWDWTNTHTPGGASSAFFEGDCVVTTGGILEASAPPTSDYVDTDDTGNGSFAWNKRNITATDIQAFVEVPFTT
jgi:hypothetical protein